MDIMAIATANTRSDMTVAVNVETSKGKSLEMMPHSISIDSQVVKLPNQPL